MKFLFKIILLLLFPVLLSGQQNNSYLNNLHTSLAIANSDTARMLIFGKLGSYYSLEDRDSTRFYLEKALPIAARLNLKLNEASLLNSKGIILVQEEKFSKSLESYLNAINIVKDPAVEKTIWNLPPGKTATTERMLVLSSSYDLIGLLNAYSGNWIDNINNQLKNYREAKKYALVAGDTGQLASIDFHMGIAYMNAGELDTALLLIKKAQTVFSNLNDPQYGRTLIYEGEVYHRKGEYNVAKTTITDALEFLNKTNDFVHRGLGNLALGRVFVDLLKVDSALHYAKQSLIIFEKRKDQAWKKDACNLLAYCYDQQGRADSANWYIKLAKSLSDSLGVEVRKNLLAFQDVVVDEQAKSEKLEKEKIQTKNKIRTYSLLAGLILITLVGIILYRNNKKEKKAKIVLEQTLDELRSAQSQLIQSAKMASLGELTAGIAHEIQNPLNFVNNFSELNRELIEEFKNQKTALKDVEKDEILKDIDSNLEKINFHGKRADAIVKGMLQHSRTSSGQKELTDINALCDEYVRLSYHGLRAKDKSFNAKFETNFDPSLPKVSIVPQEIGRVILNLINNAFYACTERSRGALNEKLGQAQTDNQYIPTVEVSTTKDGDNILISVRDNGNGIPDSIKEKIFQPFYTTKPTGQGTGLGLSLSYDIVHSHGGTLRVSSEENEGTEFVIQLPIKNQ